MGIAAFWVLAHHMFTELYFMEVDIICCSTVNSPLFINGCFK